MIIKNAKIVMEDGILDDGFILMDNGKITAISNSKNIMPKDTEIIDAGGRYLMSGFIDQHTHGGYGYDVMDGTVESLQAISSNIIKEGITSFVPTTMASGKTRILKVLKNIKDYNKSNKLDQAEIVGIHLEGPFINKEFRGAQAEENILDISIEIFEKYQREAGRMIKIVTYAPELDDNFEFLKYLCSKDIRVQVGHSGASCGCILEAVKYGLTGVTHMHNGQSGHHHRTPGVLTAGLLTDDLKSEIICDLVHIVPDSIRLAYKCKGEDNMILITDSIRAKGLVDGNYELGGQDVRVVGKEARLHNGTLAGSVLKMNEAGKNAKDILGVTMPQLSKLLSANAAKNLGIFDNKGSITVGKDADLVMCDENLNIVKVIKAGKIVVS